MKLCVSTIFFLFILLFNSCNKKTDNSVAIIDTTSVHSKKVWTKLTTLPKSEVKAIAIKGSSLFVGTYGGGVFLSNDNGATWDTLNSGLANPKIYALVFSGNNLIAGSESGIFYSLNNGNHWTSAGNQTPPAINTFIVHDSILFMGSAFGGYRSFDNGITWSIMNSELTGDVVRSFAAIDSNIFAGTHARKRVYRSTNNGNSWVGCDSASINGYVFSLATNSNSLFAGTNNGVYISTTMGSLWTSVNSGMTGKYVFALTIVDTNIFAGTEMGVFLSTNNGNNWVPFNDSLPSNSTINTFAVNGKYLYLGTRDGIYYLLLQ